MVVVLVVVTVVVVAGSVVVVAVIPRHEHAEEYRTDPEHADAYVGTAATAAWRLMTRRRALAEGTGAAVLLTELIASRHEQPELNAEAADGQFIANDGSTLSVFTVVVKVAQKGSASVLNRRNARTQLSA